MTCLLVWPDNLVPILNHKLAAQRATRRSWATGESTSAAGRSSASPLRAPPMPTPTWCCLTTRCLRWTRGCGPGSASCSIHLTFKSRT